jgi:thiamine-phosphate pyrophosphorylase
MCACQTDRVNDRRKRLQEAVLYLVCDERADAFLSAALRGGVDIVQLRMKDGTEEAILAAAHRYRPLCREAGALLIINDRPDLAAEVDADGVHVGQDDVDVAEARSLVGEERLVGLSTHSPAQLDASARAGLDYIGVGPVNATPTKPGRPAVGLELIAYAARRASVPFFAIGGIGTANASAVRAAGAQRIAVVRALTEADDVEAAARRLRDSMIQEQPVGAT